MVKRRGGGRERGVISKPPIDEMDGRTFLFFPSHFLEGPGAGITQTEGGIGGGGVIGARLAV